MKTKCNKLIALLLSLTMLMGVVMSTPMTAVAATETSSVVVNYTEGIELLDEVGLTFVGDAEQIEEYGYKVNEDKSGHKVTFSPESGHLGAFGFAVKKEKGEITNVDFPANGESSSGAVSVVKTSDLYMPADLDLEIEEEYYYDLYMYTIKSNRSSKTSYTINVTKSTAPKIVTLPASTADFQILDEHDREITDLTQEVVSGSDFTFKVRVTKQNSEGYLPQVTVGGQTLNAEPAGGEDNVYTYKITAITANKTVYVAINPKQFTVKAKSIPDGVDVTGLNTNGTNVNYGASFTFYVTPQSNYETPEVTYTMGDKPEQKISPAGNTYVIDSVTANVEVTIKTPTKKQRTVTFVGGAGYSFAETTGGSLTTKKIDADQTLDFKVNVTTGYNGANKQVAVNGVVLSDRDGTYTVPASTADQSVTVTGVAQNQYTVTLVNGTGYTLRALSSTTVPHGGEFKFTVALDAGYQYNSGGEPTIMVSPSGTATKDSTSGANAYKVSSVTDNISISVTNVEVTKHTVSSDAGNQSRHATVNLNGGQASHNGNLTFSVQPDQGYKVNTVTVETDGGHALNVIKGSDNNWTVSGVTDNCTVSVTTTPVVITVTYNDNSPTGGSNTVSYTYDGSRTNLKDYLEDPTGVRYYTFGGWKSTRGGEDETDKTFTTADDTVTVYGTWSIDIESLFSVDLQPVTGQAGAPEGETTLDLIVKWNPDTGADTLTAQANTKITDAGILYSNSQFDFTSKDLADAISKLLAQNPQNGKQAITKETVDNNEHVYYYGYKNNGNFGDSRNNTKTVRFRVKDSANRYAIGWVAVYDGQKTYVILSDGTTSQHVFVAQG